MRAAQPYDPDEHQRDSEREGGHGDGVDPQGLVQHNSGQRNRYDRVDHGQGRQRHLKGPDLEGGLAYY